MTNRHLMTMFFLISLAIFLLVAAVSAFLWISYQRTVIKTTLTEQPQLSAVIPTPTPDPLASFGVLLLGYGGVGHDGGSLTDTIILALINPRMKNALLISIPRDLWVTLPITNQTNQPISEKINAAYAIGNNIKQYPHRPDQFSQPSSGGMVAMQVISEITGLPVKYFIALDFQGFENAVNRLGGIEVAVKTGFDDPFYPLPGEENNTCGKSEEEITALTATLSGEKLSQAFTCRYEHIYFDAGRQLFNGAAALKLVRSRHSTQSGNDFARAERQQLVIQAIKQKALALSVLPKLLPLINDLSYHVQTNIDAATLSKYSKEVSELDLYQINTLVISEQNVLKAGRNNRGQYVLLPKSENNWQELQSFLTTEISSISEPNDPTSAP